MAHAQSTPKQHEPTAFAPLQKVHRAGRAAGPESVKNRSVRNLVTVAIEAHRGVAKADATQLFQRVAATSALPLGKIRAELIPDSSWKRAGKTLGPQASQTTARLGHVLSSAKRIWGNEPDATEWLNSPHPELQGATPFSLLKTEAGGRAVEALLGALEFGFPV
jgi:putative toxin-antitoxin system antitoxin component (TIGR02293 family)